VKDGSKAHLTTMIRTKVGSQTERKKLRIEMKIAINYEAWHAAVRMLQNDSSFIKAL